MTRIPAVGERVYAWRPVGRERRRIPGTVEGVSTFSWVSYAIGVRMDDTGQVEHFEQADQPIQLVSLHVNQG